MSDEKNCSTCKYAGWDPDGNYCAAPKVLEKHIYGRRLTSNRLRGLDDYCSGPDFPLYEEKENQ